MNFTGRYKKNTIRFPCKYFRTQWYSAKIFILMLYSNNIFVRFSREISGNFGKFRNSENSGNCRKIFSGKIPGNFPPDFPVFSGDENNVTARILSFKKLKIEEISGNFGRTFSGNSGKFSPKNVGKFSPNFSVFF